MIYKEEIIALTCIDNHHLVIVPIYGKLNTPILDIVGLDQDFVPKYRIISGLYF